MRSSLVALVVLAVTSGRAFADPIAAPVVEPARWQLVLRLLAGVDSFHYHETTPGNDNVDHHDAALPTGQLAVIARSPARHLYLRATFALTGGSMTYVGETQAGAPVTGPTTGSMTHSELAIGAGTYLPQHDAVWLGGYLGFSYSTWDRDLRPIGAAGYREVYTWTDVPIGVLAEIAASDQLTLTFDSALYLPVVTGTMHVTDIAGYDPADVQIASSTGLRFQVAGSYALSPALHLIAMLGYERNTNNQGSGTELTQGGAGTGIVIGEPASITDRFAAHVGAAYAF